MSPQTRSKSKRSNEKNVTIYTQQFRPNTSNVASNAESSAQAAARSKTTLINQQKQPAASITKKTPAKQLCKKVIGVSQIEQEPRPQVPAAATATTINGVHKKTQVPENDNDNDQDSSKDDEQEPDENQQAHFSEKQNIFCFKGEGKFHLNFPIPLFSAGISDTSLLCGNKSNNTFVPTISATKHVQHNKIRDDTNNISSHLKDDINRILENLRDMSKTIKTLTRRNENYRKRGYSAISDNYYEQQQEEKQILKRPRRAQSEDTSGGDSLFSEVSSRVLELRDQIKKGEEQLNLLHNQYGQLEKLYHEAFGVIHCNNKIARNAAVIQFSHKANTIASNTSSLWNSSDKLDKDAKQLMDIFMDESFEG
ncbi:hypothetical protein BDC45DRAFT_536946 [Circinella umbellata]|nr:hypothetical protein BDC45DRAFT_536946 [Circinella umbellata]